MKSSAHSGLPCMAMAWVISAAAGMATAGTPHAARIRARKRGEKTAIRVALLKIIGAGQARAIRVKSRWRNVAHTGMPSSRRQDFRTARKPPSRALTASRGELSGARHRIVVSRCCRNLRRMTRLQWGHARVVKWRCIWPAKRIGRLRAAALERDLIS
jgi:hypothetical protein